MCCRLFGMSREKGNPDHADRSHPGKASCGTFTRDVAETKAAQVIKYARENQHPLMCEVERFQ